MDEFTIRLASKSDCTKTSVFKLHKDDDVSWKDARMKRDNELQPWQIKLGSGKFSRNFKAIKDGGVGDNASYYVLYKNTSNSKIFEACPIDDWYSMSATQRYKTLTAEEAEEKFEKRHKMFNLFSVMGIKKNADEGGEGEMSNTKGFKVSEFDEWNQSGDDEASGQEFEDGDDSKRKVRRKKGVKKDEDAPIEGKEESDEGDYEEREVDYMSDSSSDSSEAPEERKEENDVKGIAEEEGLRDLLSTEDEDDDNPDKIKKPEIAQFSYKSDPDASGSEDSSDSDDYDVDDENMDSVVAKDDLPASVKKELKQDADSVLRSDNPSKSTALSNVNKRKVGPEVNGNIPQPQPPKRPCSENTSSCPSTPSSSSSSTFERTVEGLIVKYLRRKPMTLKNLLKEIMSKLKKMDDATRDQQNTLVETMGDIIKRLKPEQQKINGIQYLSIKKDQ